MKIKKIKIEYENGEISIYDNLQKYDFNLKFSEYKTETNYIDNDISITFTNRIIVNKELRNEI